MQLQHPPHRLIPLRLTEAAAMEAHHPLAEAVAAHHHLAEAHRRVTAVTHQVEAIITTQLQFHLDTAVVVVVPHHDTEAEVVHLPPLLPRPRLLLRLTLERHTLGEVHQAPEADVHRQHLLLRLTREHHTLGEAHHLLEVVHRQLEEARLMWEEAHPMWEELHLSSEEARHLSEEVHQQSFCHRWSLELSLEFQLLLESQHHHSPSTLTHHLLTASKYSNICLVLIFSQLIKLNFDYELISNGNDKIELYNKKF